MWREEEDKLMWMEEEDQLMRQGEGSQAHGVDSRKTSQRGREEEEKHTRQEELRENQEAMRIQASSRGGEDKNQLLKPVGGRQTHNKERLKQNRREKTLTHKTCQNLTNVQAHGPDDIFALKECAETLDKPQVSLKFYLNEGSNRMKIRVNLAPIYIKQSLNYRPVSPSSMAIRMLEKISRKMIKDSLTYPRYLLEDNTDSERKDHVARIS